MGKVIKSPVVIENEITIRSMMYVSLSYDHRVIDGATAVNFLQRVKQKLEAPHTGVSDE
jgi:2-oxoglutarate dehydrogenase E2 component (dihydrolipoamide succinyltransferase)